MFERALEGAAQAVDAVVRLLGRQSSEGELDGVVFLGDQVIVSSRTARVLVNRLDLRVFKRMYIQCWRLAAGLWQSKAIEPPTGSRSTPLPQLRRIGRSPQSDLSVTCRIDVPPRHGHQGAVNPWDLKDALDGGFHGGARTDKRCPSREKPKKRVKTANKQSEVWNWGPCLTRSNCHWLKLRKLW